MDDPLHDVSDVYETIGLINVLYHVILLALPRKYVGF
jgi:hypothetical protein